MPQQKQLGGSKQEHEGADVASVGCDCKLGEEGNVHSGDEQYVDEQQQQQQDLKLEVESRQEKLPVSEISGSPLHQHGNQQEPQQQQQQQLGAIGLEVSPREGCLMPGDAKEVNRPAHMIACMAACPM